MAVSVHQASSLEKIATLPGCDQRGVYLTGFTSLFSALKSGLSR